MKLIMVLILFLWTLTMISAQTVIYDDCDTEDLDTASFIRLPWVRNEWDKLQSLSL